jgi:CRISPR-associated exonuclease Cas4
MFHEDDLIAISALQHFIFCERQCALIHIEQSWAENRLTAEGRLMHNRAHDGAPETRGNLRIVRGLRLRSLEYGIVGQADVVEFLAPESAANRVVGSLRELTRWTESPRDWAGWKVTPVEYKRGQPKKDDSDRVQLCAQALCLRELLSIEITEGALFYGKRKRRTVVSFDEKLLKTTIQTIERVRAMIESGKTPTAVREPKCKNCSLVELCVPDAMSWGHSASQFVSLAFDQHIEDER